MKLPVNPNVADCSGLTSLQDLCQHGPSCQMIKASKYPNCDQFHCKDCLFADSQPGLQTVDGGSTPNVDFSQSKDENVSLSKEEDAPTLVAASPVDLGCNELLCKDEPYAWTSPFDYASNCNCKPNTGPLIPAVDTEGREEEDQSFSLSELFEDADSCVAYGGPGAGQTCKFPFTYDHVKYFGCAVRKQGDSKGWCSTKLDVNGIHVIGPLDDKFKYVGFCDKSCTERPLFKNEE